MFQTATLEIYFIHQQRFRKNYRTFAAKTNSKNKRYGNSRKIAVGKNANRNPSVRRT
jgi:hypothetical protein